MTYRLVKKWKLEYGFPSTNEDGSSDMPKGLENLESEMAEELSKLSSEESENKMKRIAYKPKNNNTLQKTNSEFSLLTEGGSESMMNDNGSGGSNSNEEFGLIERAATFAAKLPFISTRKAKYAAFFLKQQIKATNRIAKNSMKYTMRYVDRRSRELTLARKRQNEKNALLLRTIKAVDVEKEVSRTLFVRLVKAKNVLAMDDGGTSDPFTEIRFHGVQNVSKTIDKTVNPEWDQTFTFKIPNGKRVLDATDKVELFMYDQDQGGLNDFIGYAKISLDGEEVQDEESMKQNRKKIRAKSWKTIGDENCTTFDATGSPIKPSSSLANKITNNGNESESDSHHSFGSSSTTTALSSSSSTAQAKKPIPPVKTEVRYGKDGKKYTTKTIHLGKLPDDQQPWFFDVNHLKEKLMFWEGERKFTGTVTCEYWFGSRHDREFRASSQPKLRETNSELRAEVQHYCDPVTALLRVDVRGGRNIVNLDCEKGEDGSEGGSDPYVEVSIIDAVDQSRVKKSTHYIEESRAPLWNRTFTFMTAQPYSNTLQFKCYDYDGATSFDDLIGTYSVALHELPVRVGVKMLPEYQWVTLKDKDGNDKNSFGVPFGEIEVRAYIDEEYFDHLHGGNAQRAVGKLSVDILEANGIDKIPQGAYCVCKIGPYWSRLETVKKTEFNGDMREIDIMNDSEKDSTTIETTALDKDKDNDGGNKAVDANKTAGSLEEPLIKKATATTTSKESDEDKEKRRANKIAQLIEAANKIQWNKRLIYPVSEPSDEVIVSVFNAENDQVIGTIKLPLSCMEDGVRYENTCTLMMNANQAMGDIRKNGTLTLAFTFTHYKGGALLARKYIRPKLPAKWYYYPLSKNEMQRMLYAQKDVIVRKLLQANPPIPESVSQHILAYSKHKVNVMMIKSSIARIEQTMTGFVKLHKGITFVFSWDSIIVTALAQCLLVFWIYHPEWLVPSFCFGLSLNALLLFPGRYQRVLDRMVPNEFLSVGIAAAPEDLHDALKMKNQDDKDLEIDAKNKLIKAGAGAFSDSDDEGKEVKKDDDGSHPPTPTKKQSTKRKEANPWEAINPLVQIQKQLDEVTLLITQSQTIMDDIAGGVERFIGMFTWSEPRVTAMIILVVLASGWSALYIQEIVSVAFHLLTGVVAKVIFKIVTAERVKFACTCGLLWLLRHPALFPDDIRRAIQEEKNARIEAQLLAEAKKDADGAIGEDVDVELQEALKDAPPKVDYLFDPRPLPPLNIFFRIPTRGSQLV